MPASLALALALAAPPDLAGPGLALRWQAPVGCPAEDEVRARVVRIVGEEAVQKTMLVADASVLEASDRRWNLDLSLSGATGGGRRSLSAARCDELADAAALVIAIAVDPQAALGGPVAAGSVAEVPVPPAPEPTPPAPEPIAEAPQPQPAPATEELAPPVVAETGTKEQVRADRVRFAVRAAAGVSFARLLPGPSAALDVALSASGRRWRVELGGFYAPPVRGASAQPEIGGLFQFGAAYLRGCPVLGRGRIAVPLCAGLQFGAMEGRGRGSGLAVAYVARAPWIAGTLGAALAVRLVDRVSLWVQADALVSFTRPSFVTAGMVPVHQAARLGGHALVGVEFRVR